MKCGYFVEFITGTRWLSLNGDNPEDAAVLNGPTDLQLRGLLATHEALFIDEAQRIPEIGMTLKRVHDQYPRIKVMVTGSANR